MAKVTSCSPQQDLRVLYKCKHGVLGLGTGYFKTTTLSHNLLPCSPELGKVLVPLMWPISKLGEGREGKLNLFLVTSGVLAKLMEYAGASLLFLNLYFWKQSLNM